MKRGVQDSTITSYYRNGRVMEQGRALDIFQRPTHPYTIGLLSTRGHGGRLEGRRLPAIPGWSAANDHFIDCARECAHDCSRSRP